MDCVDVHEDFSARFECKYREYHYFFQRKQLDLQSMRKGCEYLKGKHDFRNFCKLNVLATTNYEREILDARIEKEPTQNFIPINSHPGSINPFELHYLVVKGNAFLWHQIRCIMQVLFSIGCGFDQPEVVNELFDIEKFKSKPG